MILFFGPPGSGKSVQGDLLVQRNEWQWLSTGQLFRDSKDPEVLQRLASGELIDDALTNKVLASALEKIDTTINVVLDGYPRNTEQAQWLMDNLTQFNRMIECVVKFDVPTEEIVKRLSERGRAEDGPDVVQHRLEIYREKTKPVLEYFRGKNVPLVTIDGVGSVDEVHERIQEAVEACLHP